MLEAVIQHQTVGAYLQRQYHAPCVARTRSSAHAQGFKVGLCSVPPVGVPHALLCLANNTAITSTFTCMRERFDKLYKRK